MRTKIFAIVMVLMMISGMAVASGGADGLYLKGGLAYTNPEDATINGSNLSTSLDSDVGVKLAVGYDFGQMFRIEGEWLYQKNDAENINVSSIGKVNITNSDIAYNAFLVNGIVDFMVADNIGLYGVGGIGWGDVDASLYSGGADDSGFAWKIGFGAFYDITDNWVIDVGYEYLTFDNVDLDGYELKDLASHNIVASVIFKF
ncbi:MAG: opacity protein-like surface antigen [Desulforhopalus sp.]|jgi:opacity protein-like surface antigen